MCSATIVRISRCSGRDFFFLRIGRPPRSTLLPYTTLFRSTPCRSACDPPLRAESHRRAASGQPAHRAPGVAVRAACRLALPRRSEEHTSELQSPQYLVYPLLIEKKLDSTRLSY